MSTHQHVVAERSNVDVVMNIYEAFGRGDLPAVLNAIDPQADLHFEGPAAVPWTGQFHGREGWTSFFRTFGEHVADVVVTMKPFAVQGEHVVAAGRYQGRVKGTGKLIDSPLVHLWTIRHGMVVGCVELTNTAAEAAACAPEA